MLQTIRKVYDLLTTRQRRQAVGLFILTLFVSLLQLGAVTSIMPFMAVVADPEIVKRNAGLGWLYDRIGLEMNGFLLFMGTMVFLAVVVSNIAAAANLWANDRFTWSVTANLSRDLLRRYLHRSYLWFARHGSADAGKNILSEVESFTGGFLHSLIMLVVKGLTVCGLLVVIIAIDWKIALFALVFIGGVYSIIYAALRRHLMEIGERCYELNRQRFKAVQEAFGAFQETKVFQREAFFVSAYENPTQRLIQLSVQFSLVRGLPRHLLEVIAFGGLVLLVLYFVSTTNDFRRIVPILSLYAFAGYRMMPALQQCFSCIASLRFNQYLVDQLHRNFYEEADFVSCEKQLQEWSRETRPNLSFRRELRFENVTFAYSEGDVRMAVKEVNLSISSHTMVAFCGATGSGKTTILNLLLGLLSPQQGEISVDGVPLAEDRLGEWRQSLGFVPQHIFLMDDTVARNIAFGLPDERIDMVSVIRAAKAAQIHDFIIRELPAGYDTEVGERGIRLSGGERQRLGIARALYHDPDVLVFDEATSALDNPTEGMVMEAIQNAARSKTVILVAHRLTTVKGCDRIFVVEEGRVVEQGAFDELAERKGSFSLMLSGG